MSTKHQEMFILSNKLYKDLTQEFIDCERIQVPMMESTTRRPKGNAKWVLPTFCARKIASLNKNRYGGSCCNWMSDRIIALLLPTHSKIVMDLAGSYHVVSKNPTNETPNSIATTLSLIPTTTLRVVVTTYMREKCTPNVLQETWCSSACDHDPASRLTTSSSTWQVPVVYTQTAILLDFMDSSTAQLAVWYSIVTNLSVFSVTLIELPVPVEGVPFVDVDQVVLFSYIVGSLVLLLRDHDYVFSSSVD